MIRQRPDEWESRRFFLLSLLGLFLPGRRRRHAQSGNKVQKKIANVVRRIRHGSSYTDLATPSLLLIMSLSLFSRMKLKPRSSFESRDDFQAECPTRNPSALRTVSPPPLSGCVSSSPDHSFLPHYQARVLWGCQPRDLTELGRLYERLQPEKKGAFADFQPVPSLDG